MLNKLQGNSIRWHCEKIIFKLTIYFYFDMIEPNLMYLLILYFNNVIIIISYIIKYKLLIWKIHKELAYLSIHIFVDRLAL